MITSLAIICTLFIAHKSIQAQFDLQLIRTSQYIQACFSDYSNQGHQLEIIKHFLDYRKEITTGKINDVSFQKKNKRNVEKKIEFQVWSQKKKLILSSKLAPKISLLMSQKGLSTLFLDGQSWRINTVYDHKKKLTIIVAERSGELKKLEKKLTKQSIFIIFFACPVLGFLIWIIVGRSLNILRRVVEEIRHRGLNNLKSLDLESFFSEIKPLATELNRLFQRLKRDFDKEKNFTADVVHELNTPLASLSLQTQIALRAKTNEVLNEALLKVLADVNRIVHIVQQLSTISQMAPETKINKSACVDLNKKVTEIATLLAPDVIAKNIELEFVTSDASSEVLGNSTLIGILIRNLVDNAIRYTHLNGKVTIKVKADQDTVSIHVIDNGPGIPKKFHARVFERFFRVLGNQETGSGLGLGIVKNIAKLHHADIQLHTPETGIGLQVEVIFPKDWSKSD